MKDIDIAKQRLDEKDLTLVLVRNGEIIFEGAGRGIKELSTLYREQADLLKGSSAADTVIGKAAAMFYVAGGISELKADLLSEAAQTYLTEHQVPYTYTKLTEYILNQRGQALCPMEKISLASPDVATLETGIMNFFKKIKSNVGGN